MFWKKQKFNDEDVGELTFEVGYWNFTSLLGSEELLIDVEGSIIEPDADALQQAKRVLKNIESIHDEANKFINEQGISHFTKGMEHTTLDRFSSYKEIGKYDVRFGLSNWDDAIIVVHFQSNKPSDISLSD